jgi:hypothetical protein
MEEFLQGFAERLELPPLHQVLACYNEKGTELFFDLLEVTYQLGQDLLDGNSDPYRELVETIDELYEDLTPYSICQWQTNDWKEVLHKINPEYKIPAQDAFYLQFITKFNKLHSEGQVVELSMLLDRTQSELIEGNYKQAGFEYADAYAHSRSFVNESMIEYLKLEAFDMGFMIAMDFSYDDSSISCYTNNSAKPSIELFYQLSKAITESDASNIANTSEMFFKESSERMKGQLSDGIESCLENIPGTKRFAEKFKLDPNVPVFPYALTYFAKKRPEPYYNSMTRIWEMFDDWDFLNAGVTFGDLLKKVLSEYNNKNY